MSLSRRKVAEYLVDSLGTAQRPDAIRQVAAWLMVTRRRRQSSYIARDVAQLLEQRGYLQAHIISARPLTTDAHKTIAKYLHSTHIISQLEITAAVDPSLISGVEIATPSARLEATGRKQLGQLIHEASR